MNPTRQEDRLRWGLIVPLVILIAIIGLLASFFVPVYSHSTELQFSTGSTTSTDVSIPHAAWVTVHFDHPGGMGMMYGMNGPSGMMFSHQGMMGGDSYSFATWGGTFHCWASFEGSGSGTMPPVWVNVTWGAL